MGSLVRVVLEEVVVVVGVPVVVAVVVQLFVDGTCVISHESQGLLLVHQSSRFSPSATINSFDQDTILKSERKEDIKHHNNSCSRILFCLEI